MAKLDEKYDAKKVMDDIFSARKTNNTRRILERVWYRNILYYMGEQWISWYHEQGTFKKRPRYNIVPTPVANKIRDSVRAEKALILNKNYVPRVYPNNNELTDIEGAAVAEAIIRDMDLRNEEEFKDEKDKVAEWMLLAGTAFMRTVPDISRGKYGIDKNGELIPSGEVRAEAVAPFSVVLDPQGDTMRKKRYAGVVQYVDREWVEDIFGVKVENATDRDEMQYAQTLMKYVGNVSPWKSAGLNVSLFDENFDDLVEFRELEFRPTKNFPNGRYIVMVNGQILRDSKRLIIPFDEKESEDWMYALTDFHYFKVPGRFWSDAFVNDLISPQDIINTIDQTLIMNRRSLGRPRIALPEGTKMERLNEFGESFLAFKFDARLTGGQKPEFAPGIPYPHQIIEERRMNQENMQDASGDPKNVLKGQVPTAGASGALVDILQESAESSHGPMVAAFYRGLNKVYRKRLILAKELYTEKRTIKIVGPNKKYEVKSFTGADIHNNTDIRLELSSGIFKTKASEANSLINLMQTGQFENDPIIKREILKKLGLADLTGDSPNVEVKRAEKEALRILEGDWSELMLPGFNPGNGLPDFGMETPPSNIDPIFKYDNHALHLECHKRFILGDEFQKLGKKERIIFMSHAELHKTVMEAEMQKMQAQQMAMAMAQQQAMQQAQQPAQPEGAPPEEMPPGGGMAPAPLEEM